MRPTAILFAVSFVDLTSTHSPRAEGAREESKGAGCGYASEGFGTWKTSRGSHEESRASGGASARLAMAP